MKCFVKMRQKKHVILITYFVRNVLKKSDIDTRSANSHKAREKKVNFKIVDINIFFCYSKKRSSRLML
jgi:hypothetical protein